MKQLLPATLTIEEWNNIKTNFKEKCAYCGKKLPLTQEHFIPVTQGGAYAISNIIPVCLSCNCSKQDMNFFIWYPKQEYHSKKREKFILEYLNYEV